MPMEQKQYNEQRSATFAQRQADANNIVRLEVNQPRPPPRQGGIKGMDAVSFLPSFTSNPFVPPQFANQLYPGPSLGYGYNPMIANIGPSGFSAINVNKVYDIQVGGPASSHATVKMIYEDLLPVKNVSASFKSINERFVQYEYVRGILFSNGDGQSTDFTGSGTNSLLSHIKFLKLNPYNSYRFSDNPYKGLPEGFLIYNSCYPIRRNTGTGNIECSRDSIGINVRIYKLNQAAFLINKQNLTKFFEYNQWREVVFYEFIREKILKNKECPHFLLCYGYYLSNNSGIDFNKVNRLGAIPDKNKMTPDAIMKTNLRTLEEQANESRGLVNPALYGIAATMPETVQLATKAVELISNLKSVNGSSLVQAPLKKDLKKEDLDFYNGEVLAVITEAPTYHLFDWLSDKNISNTIAQNVITTISSGNKNDNIWRSILFQLMVALATLQKHSIYIDNFNLERNVFIKEVGGEGMATTYWKYKIDGLDYYIPNFGYILVIDSNYADVDAFDSVLSRSLLKLSNNSKKYKINCFNIYGTDKEQNDDSFFDDTNVIVRNETFWKDTIYDDMFKKSFDSSIYGDDFKMRGFKPPSDLVIQLIDKIKALTTKLIKKNIYENMRYYLNNRIGTYLRENELVHVRDDATKDFVKGQMIVYDDVDSGAKKFVMFIEKLSSSDDCRVLTRTDIKANITTDEIYSKDIEEMDVNIGSLSLYSRAEPIQQNIKTGEINFNDENLIDTFVLTD
jgi:hypothetical protein